MPLAVHADHDAVRRVFAFEHERLLTPFDQHRLLHDGGVLPPAADLDLMAVLGIQPLHIEIRGVGIQRGHAPGHVIVVPESHTRQPGRRRADHVPARRGEMNEVAQATGWREDDGDRWPGWVRPWRSVVPQTAQALLPAAGDWIVVKNGRVPIWRNASPT